MSGRQKVGTRETQQRMQPGYETTKDLRPFFHSRVKSQCNSFRLIGANLNYLHWNHPQCVYLLSS